MKDTMTELNNSTENFNSRLNETEERISTLEDRSFEIIQRGKKKNE